MGKISRIQLRGISRTPSDRLTADGGCDESLNVYLEDEELVPVLKPGDITSRIKEGTLPSDHDILYLHKTASADNYIILNGTYVGHYIDQKFKAFFQLTQDERIKDIISVGNTLVFATTSGMKYVLYKEGGYLYLGDRIPEPKINFITIPTESELQYDIKLNYDQNATDGYGKVLTFDPETFNAAVRDERAGIQNDGVTTLRNVHHALWTGINAFVKQQKALGIMTAPLFVRYALRLFDGTYCYQSVPILLGAGYQNSFEVTGTHMSSNNVALTYTFFNVLFPNHYRASAQIENWDIASWGDLIESIDIFASTDVNYPAMNARFNEVRKTGEEAVDSVNYQHYSFEFFHEGEDKEAVERELLNASQFYKIASFRPDDMEDLSLGYNLTNSTFLTSQDSLVLQERLPDYEQSGALIIPDRLAMYNGRVIALAGKSILPSGHPFLQSTTTKNKSEVRSEYLFRYYVSSRDGILHEVIGRNEYGTPSIFPYNINGLYAEPYGIMFYPDSSCQKAEVSIDGVVYTITMKPHPYLNCAYAYWGLDKKIKDEYKGEAIQLNVSTENNVEANYKSLRMSNTNNPFYFPLSGNKTMGANVLGVAVANMALSEGQFGQYPLYIFTEDGIWAMEIGADGGFRNSHALSREVCSNPDSITSIDQAVVFISKKGLMVLSGSQIAELSPHMNGRHYTIDATAETIVNGQDGFCDMLNALKDATPFSTFMDNASIGYDYAGKRLICINPRKPYQYVYKMGSKTWHKIYHTGYEIQRPLNSYPSCEVSAKDSNGETVLLDLSVVRDGSMDQHAEKAIVVTRPFNLDDPDVLKTIQDARIRGPLKGSYRFILQGSQDGVNFYTISTLRGKAWKMFRIIILGSLDIFERISWIDVMYETRFTNKLR